MGWHVYPWTVVSVSWHHKNSTILCVLVYYKADLIMISLKINLFSSWTISELALNNNHSQSLYQYTLYITNLLLYHDIQIHVSKHYTIFLLHFDEKQEHLYPSSPSPPAKLEYNVILDVRHFIAHWIDYYFHLYIYMCSLKTRAIIIFIELIVLYTIYMYLMKL